MKTKLLIIAAIAALMTSCGGVSNYYQIFKTTSEGMQQKNNVLIYEDDNCVVTYYLWSDGGNSGFNFENKTDKDIYLDLDKCFFILNGTAFNYFRNRTYSFSQGTGTSANVSKGNSRSGVASVSVEGINYFDYLQTNSVTAMATQSITASYGVTTSHGSAISYEEQKEVCVPAKASKAVSEYLITKSLYRDCDLLRYPSKKQTSSKTFTKDNSPFVFSNRIVYKVGPTDSLHKFENVFFVSEISNLPESSVVASRRRTNCGQELELFERFFKESPPNKFYINYQKTSSWTH